MVVESWGNVGPHNGGASYAGGAAGSGESNGDVDELYLHFSSFAVYKYAHPIRKSELVHWLMQKNRQWDADDSFTTQVVSVSERRGLHTVIVR